MNVWMYIKTYMYESNVLKKCKISLKILLQMSNNHIRELAKRVFHGIDPLWMVMLKTPIKQDFFNQWNLAAC